MSEILEQLLSRRGLFQSAFAGFAGSALLHLANQETLGREAVRPSFDTRPRQSHFEPRAKSVIYLCMQGGPSQVDLFEPKAALKKFHGKTPPRELTTNAVFETDRRGQLMNSPWSFNQHGENGVWLSELLPHMAREADNITVINSMHSVHPNHEPACYKIQSGQTFPGHPTMGSWITYGLGSENQNLPAYLVLADPITRLPTNGVENWMSGYLPPLYQGTPMRPTGTPLLNLAPEYEEPSAVTLAKRGFLGKLDRLHQERRQLQGPLDARIRNYEMAARMQLEAEQTLDFADESAETLEMYGLNDKTTESFGRRCLLARRLVERGVRFVQLFPTGQAWDNHSRIKTSLPNICRQTDQPVAALIRDLKQRGLLDDTLVLWGGEFGRLPMAQLNNNNYDAAGRDHGPYGFSVVMAGGGVKRGFTYGKTDDIGYGAVENKVSVQDWHATILHLLGLDYERLTFSKNGLEERLTHQFETKVTTDILA